MIPTRSRLEGWIFDPILAAAYAIKTRGAAIEAAGSGIDARCRELPALSGWDGTAHQAAENAFGRAKSAAISIGDFADGLSGAMTQGYWDLSAAKSKLIQMVSEIEGEPFLVHDQWAITLRPGEMTVERVEELMKRRDSLQGLLNPMVSAMGSADSSAAETLTGAAKTFGFDVPKGSLLNPWSIPPADEIPDPTTLIGKSHQMSIAAADAALSVRETQVGTNSEGEPTKTLIMQDGSKVVLTDTSTYRGQSSREDHYAPDGKLEWYTTVRPWGDTGKTSVWTRYMDSGTVVHTLIDSAGVPNTSVHVPGKPTVSLGARIFSGSTMSQFGGALRDPATGAALAAIEFAAGDDDITRYGPKSITPAHWDNVKAGAKFGGIGLATGFALYDVATAEPEDRCESSVVGAFSVAGGIAGGVGGSVLPGANLVSAGLGAYAGTWFFEEVGKKVSDWVCN